ncbi:MAG: site-specific DNA-methyltransferase [Caldilinea sp.]|nr:site-specific DNA-methyltransferase [Caldilinea sp.]MCB0152015.1 site-specific DNA-methyltransferase [Caldilineaceae bacterium]MCO5210468.1 site-specific DNA-methyltransferase [Caldilinea sp.]MCW5845356.1 site-specific DNA-methyltransferase [Caldilinea sp.]
MKNAKASRNRTLDLSHQDRERLRDSLLRVDSTVTLDGVLDRTIYGDAFDVLPLLPASSVDLLIVDPPYNMTKAFSEQTFAAMDPVQYMDWLRQWLRLVHPLLKPTATIYICSEWRTSSAVFQVVQELFIVRNRITWEREKGRGAQRNWKNCSEDIWFCTMSETFHFDVDAVKLKRKVNAPYRHEDGSPKDWATEADRAYRLTYPSNLWTDITVPFWSMPENTDHPTQKPEKLVAKLVLASSRAGDVVLDPFLGSGTTSVVAKKLGRRYVGIEREEDYCLLAEKRLEQASAGGTIQGYAGGYFWERNSLGAQRRQHDDSAATAPMTSQPSLFKSK